MPHSSELVRSWLQRLYWYTSWFGGAALALSQLWAGSQTAQLLAVAYLVITSLAFLLTQPYPQWAPVAHLGLALGLLIWALQQPGALVPGWNQEMVLYTGATLATLGLLVLGMFGGLWVMLGGLVLLVALVPHPAAGPYWVVWPLWALGGLVGVAVFRAIGRLEAAQQELSRVALQDRQTGLSTRLALEADYQRYQALARRSDQPLLFSYWLLSTSSPDDQLLQELAQLMREALRQGDGLYRIDEDHFCGLHIGLLSGHELTERLSQRFASARVVWVACNGLSLEEALRQAQELLYRSPRRPTQLLAATPKA
ncbi:MAG: diguanylate cyclase [Meiothermus sp.]|jgi:GGDEF domain-containing protein|uniref:GGDEF domain-containing protein n=1 Tax=Meiothermus sp. TaxID=1955249 RepID=UPI0028CD31FA|nr:diguanylate cyclase [Meiothermus sp.]MDT7920259.1 diguanylate cyclase [Meiothermus sp.]